jgi:RNA polymerase sigma factor (sigma-70 family)
MSPKDSETIDKFYRTESKKLLGFIRKRIPRSIEAEDILQDVFYQLTLGFRDLERIRNLTSWIYRVTENRIVDLFRKNRPLNISFDDLVSDSEDGNLSLKEILPAIEQSYEDDDLKELVWEKIWTTLDNLPAEQREVFIATEFEDMSFREISENTGAGINTLISRKRYAVLELRKQLENINKLFKNK